MKKRGYSRRDLLRLGVASVCSAGLVQGVFSRAATAQQKVAKKMVQYQTAPKDGHQCSGCEHFVAPKACKVVEGDISPRGWCAIWTPKTSK